MENYKITMLYEFGSSTRFNHKSTFIIQIINKLNRKGDLHMASIIVGSCYITLGGNTWIMGTVQKRSRSLIILDESHEGATAVRIIRTVFGYSWCIQPRGYSSFLAINSSYDD